MESPDNLSPKTPWHEPLTPDNFPGVHDPVFYNSSQENNFGYEDINTYKH